MVLSLGDVSKIWKITFLKLGHFLDRAFLQNRIMTKYFKLLKNGQSGLLWKKYNSIKYRGRTKILIEYAHNLRFYIICHLFHNSIWFQGSFDSNCTNQKRILLFVLKCTLLYTYYICISKINFKVYHCFTG